ncbi:MAG: VUT family protein, partial [Clostridia bacterium]|nr:VUT family protein [Clostridia bacterium]
SPDGVGAYICRTYVSSAVGQFVDNFVFAIIVSKFFFGWSWVQCVTCAVTGMLVELVCEAAFSPLGYLVCRKWKERGAGKEYFEYVQSRKGGNI